MIILGFKLLRFLIFGFGVILENYILLGDSFRWGFCLFVGFYKRGFIYLVYG